MLWESRKLYPETTLGYFVTCRVGFRNCILHRAIFNCILTKSHRARINSGIVIAAMISSVAMGCGSKHPFPTHVIMDTHSYPQPVHILIYIRRNSRSQDKSKEGRSKNDRLSADVVIRLMIFSSFPIIGITLVIYLHGVCISSHLISSSQSLVSPLRPEIWGDSISCGCPGWEHCYCLLSETNLIESQPFHSTELDCNTIWFPKGTLSIANIHDQNH